MKSRAVLLSLSIFLKIEALPVSPILESGEAFFSEQPNFLEVQCSDQVVINWNEFSIEEKETVKFCQPNSNSCVLNCVLDIHPSRILGNLKSNGQVILLNPNGILVGQGAKIDVGSFIASTLDLQSKCFLKNKELKFSGDSFAAVINFGDIHSHFGPVALVGHEVTHAGTIEIENGFGALLATNETLFNFNHEIPISIPQTSKVSQMLIDGSITAKGANVYVMGEHIFLKDGSLIDVSHDFNGGNVRIGGNGQANFSQAKVFIFEEGSQIIADSILEGKGGEITLLSSEKGVAYGSVFSRGGKFKGDGGFVEISANQLLFDGYANLTAENGKSGLFYLDPTDIVIGAITCPSAVIGCPSSWTAACGCPVNFSAAAIAAILGGGTDVCIDTNNPPDLGCVGLGTIILNPGNNIAWNTNANLTLSANQSITIFSNIQNSAPGAGNIVFNGNANLVQINGNGGNQAVSVGSQNGLTQINTPNAIVSIVASASAPSRFSQLGFFAPANSTCAGPIQVTCSNLNVQANTQTFTYAQLGHGNMLINSGFSTTNASAISITAANDIFVGPFGISLGSESLAQIGHGIRVFLGAGNTLAGNLNVWPEEESIFFQEEEGSLPLLE